MTTYIDREDSTVLYYSTKDEAVAARSRMYPDWDEAYLRISYARSGGYQGNLCDFEQFARQANAKPAIRESKKRPGQWYFVCPK